MKGISISFKNYSNPFGETNIFIECESWSEAEKKLEKAINKISEKHEETVSYFNWMNIDSDFQRDYDAEISVYYKDNETEKERSSSYKIDFNVVNVKL